MNKSVKGKFSLKKCMIQLLIIQFLLNIMHILRLVLNIEVSEIASMSLWLEPLVKVFFHPNSLYVAVFITVIMSGFQLMKMAERKFNTFVLAFSLTMILANYLLNTFLLI